MLCLNLIDIVVITIESVDYTGLTHDTSKSNAIHLFQNFVLDDRGYI